MEDGENSSTLKHKLSDAVLNVPYYRNRYLNKLETISIEDFPILRKSDIIGNEFSFLSKRYKKIFLLPKSTGGTTGKSLNFFKPIRDVIIETAFIDFAFSLINKNIKECVIGIMRGYQSKNGSFKRVYNQHVLSAYDLNKNSIKNYLQYIADNQINCLMVYPTALIILCKLIKSEQLCPPKLTGIISSSETLTVHDKKFILEVLPSIKLIDLYGQNEHVAFALSVNLNPYKFFNKYGFTEFVETKERTPSGNKLYEIVSTGFLNNAMPLIRYATEDLVEIDNQGNIIAIIGRSQDFLIDSEGNLNPCMVLTRDNTLLNVLSFQYFQELPGEMEFRVLVNDRFDDSDIKNIVLDIENTFRGRIKAKVSVVEEIEKTKNGKQKRLIQHLKTN